VVKSRHAQSSATEGRNPRTRDLDRKSTLKILQALNREDRSVAEAVRRELPAIARAVDLVVEALQRGGRLFYVGAGTSGRLGTLDASEIPPTFGTSPNMVQALIAGGPKALVKSVEGAEDSAAQGKKDLAARGLTSRDVVMGIAASGSTPYVLGALQLAKQRGASTIGLTSNRKSAIARRVKILIATETGPEAIGGSTRMKAGTAHKLALNMLSTTAMIRLGYVYDNWMINVAQSNEKLKRRAVKILEQAAGLEARTAAHIMRQAGDDLRVALVMAKTNQDRGRAQSRLAKAGGNVRLAIEAAARSGQRTGRTGTGAGAKP
jgi:N-acetylmuramic acid 6-phosphate etherase